MIPELQRLGFTRNEALVYTTTLQMGKCSVQQIARASGLNRLTVHSIVEKLEQQQFFLRVYDGKRRRILAVDPAQLSRLVQAEESAAQQKRSALDAVLPSLAEIYQRQQRGLEVQTLQGEEGYRLIGEDILRSATETWEYANIKYLKQAAGSFIEKIFLPQKHAKKIRSHFLFVDSPEAHAYIKDHYMKPKAAPMDVKYIDADLLDGDTYVMIYSDKVALMTPANFNAVLIKDKTLSNSMKLFFQFAWKKAGSAQTNENMK